MRRHNNGAAGVDRQAAHQGYELAALRPVDLVSRDRIDDDQFWPKRDRVALDALEQRRRLDEPLAIGDAKDGIPSGKRQYTQTSVELILAETFRSGARSLRCDDRFRLRRLRRRNTARSL